jgi:hypothetical protein
MFMEVSPENPKPLNSDKNISGNLLKNYVSFVVAWRHQFTIKALSRNTQYFCVVDLTRSSALFYFHPTAVRLKRRGVIYILPNFLAYKRKFSDIIIFIFLISFKCVLNADDTATTLRAGKSKVRILVQDKIFRAFQF